VLISSTVYEDSVRTSEETHYIIATDTSRLMLFRETVAVYCEKYMAHTNPVRTSHETYYVSATEPNRFMLFRETVAVYCENHTEHTDTFCGQNSEVRCIKTGGIYHCTLKG
jgi:hypothetical protein